MADVDATRPAPSGRAQRWSVAFQRHYDELKKTRQFTDTQLAREIGVTRAAFANWRANSVPRASLIPQIALMLADRDPVAARRIESELFEAIGQSDAASRKERPLERAQAGQAITVGVVRYSAFSLFFKRLTETLLKFAAVAPAATSPEENLKTVIRGLKEGRYDVIAGLFATPDRLTSMRFITTPIRLGVAEITGEGVRERGLTGVIPIVTSGEVGWSYARFFLDIRPEHFEEVAYDEIQFAGRLRNLLSMAQGREGVRPAIYVDELMAMQVMVELFHRLIGDVAAGRFAGVAQMFEMMPTINLGGAETRDGETPKTLAGLEPRYNLSVGVYRPEAEWYDYLSESWLIFAKSNLDFAARRYAKLFFSLRDTVNHAYTRLSGALSGIGPEFRSPIERAMADFLDVWDLEIVKWLRFDLIAQAALNRYPQPAGEASGGDTVAGSLVRIHGLDRRHWLDPDGRIEAKRRERVDAPSRSPLCKLRDDVRLDALEYPWSAIIAMAMTRVDERLMKEGGVP